MRRVTYRVHCGEEHLHNVGVDLIKADVLVGQQVREVDGIRLLSIAQRCSSLIHQFLRYTGNNTSVYTDSNQIKNNV